MSVPDRSFPSADGLATFHAGRVGLYHALFELLRMPPSSSSWDAARRGLDASASFGAEQGALGALQAGFEEAGVAAAAGEYGELFRGPRAISMRCEQPRCGVRNAAFSAVNTLPTEERSGEIQVLAALAERTMEALRARQLSEASALSDLQGRFLVHHAANCQRHLAGALRESGAAFYGRVGVALGAIVADDVRLLG